MLVPFTVDPDIFGNPYNQDELYKHTKLIELWTLYGCLLIIGSMESNSRFYEALNKAPIAVRKRWQMALKQLRKNCCISDFYSNGVENDHDWPVKLAHQVQIVSLESTRALCWGIPEDQYSLVKEKAAEICRFGYESESTVFKRAQDLARTAISKGTTWRQVWSERIEPLAVASKRIVAVDRYALKTMMEHHDRQSLSGLERLIRELSGITTGKPRILRLITAMPNTWATSELQECFQRIQECQTLLKGSGLREVQLHVRENKVCGRSAHHRYIRFDDFQLLELDTGLEPLAGNMMNRMCTVNLHSWRQDACKAYRDAEKELIAAQGSDKVFTYAV